MHIFIGIIIIALLIYIAQTLNFIANKRLPPRENFDKYRKLLEDISTHLNEIYHLILDRKAYKQLVKDTDERIKEIKTLIESKESPKDSRKTSK